MSDEIAAPPPDGTAAPPPAAIAECPINAEFLPPDKRKHVDPKAPVPLRMMAAKGLVPLAPSDKIAAMFMLMYDPDQNVRDAAAKAAASQPDVILAPALRDERLKPPVLGWMLTLYGGNDAYAEMLILNAGTPDESVAVVAASCSLKILEIIGQNQLRILRHDDIIRQLVANPNATPALIDSVCDFAVRSGVGLADVQAMTDARVRLYGPQAAEAPPDVGPTADDVLHEFEEISDEGAAPMEEGKRMSVSQKIMKMSVSEKVKLANMGNKEIRGILLRDSNRLVAVAAIRSQRITDGEILVMANNKTASDDVLRVIYHDREWTKQYPIKLALVRNPKTPQALAMKFLGGLRDSDVKSLSRDKNVPNIVQQMARKMIEKKESPKKDEK